MTWAAFLAGFLTGIGSVAVAALVALEVGRMIGAGHRESPPAPPEPRSHLRLVRGVFDYEQGGNI